EDHPPPAASTGVRRLVPVARLPRPLYHGRCRPVGPGLAPRSPSRTEGATPWYQAPSPPGGPMPHDEFHAIDTTAVPWEERFNPKLGRAILRKDLYTDPQTGAEIRLVRYPAGLVNPAHTHPCGHGLYVLEGNLVTHKGTFGPGTFVW